MMAAPYVIAVGLADVRHEPDPSSELVTQALMNVPAIPGENVGLWTHVTLPDYVGWVCTDALAEPVQKGFPRIGEQCCATPLGLVAVVNVPFTPVFEGETGEEQQDVVYLSTILPILDATPADRIQVALPDERIGWLTRKHVALQQQETAFPKQPLSTVIRYAHAFLGVPYLWGGTSWRGIDCSGFVQLCFRMSGYMLPRDADQQCDSLSVSVPRSKMRAGDLIFFGINYVTHVALALNAKEYIHSEGKNYNRVIINSFDPADEHFDRRLSELVLDVKRVV